LRTPYQISWTRLDKKTRNVIDEIAREVIKIKPLISKKKNKYVFFEPYEYDRGIYIVDVIDSIQGVVNGRKNVLTSTFWAYFLGILRDANVSDVLDISGNSRTITTSSDPTSGVARIDYGTGTTPEYFTQNALASRVGSISTTITMTILSDRGRITLSGTLPASASELGIVQNLNISPSGSTDFLLARKVDSWSSGSGVSYYIEFLNPWVQGITTLFYGLFRNVDVPMTRIDGTSFTARTGGDVSSGPSYLVGSRDPFSWSPNLYAIPNAFSISTYYTDYLSSRYLRGVIYTGIINPTSDIQLTALGLYQGIFDNGGATHTVCLLAYPVSLTLYASRNNLVMLRILVM
jgi:hypothetical protein